MTTILKRVKKLVNWVKNWHTWIKDGKLGQKLVHFGSKSGEPGQNLPRAHHYTTLHYTTLHYTTLHYTTLHYTTLHYTTLHYTTLHYTTLRYTTLHYTTLHYTMLCYAMLCYAVLYFTVFYQTNQNYVVYHRSTLLHKKCDTNPLAFSLGCSNSDHEDSVILYERRL